jgi:ribonuclease HIII
MIYTLHIDPKDVFPTKAQIHLPLLPTTDQYQAFLYYDGLTMVTVYKSGAVYLRGEDIREALKNFQQLCNIVPRDEAGSDEVGTGDLFGPVVVCCAYVPLTLIDKLISLNVRDSKKISDREITLLGGKLINLPIHHSLLVCPPTKFNELMEKGENMNSIKAKLHNQAMIRLMEKIGHDAPVVLDQFTPEKNYFGYLEGTPQIYDKIKFEVRAEQISLAVAAASIIARARFLEEFSRYQSQFHMEIPKGAGQDADLVLKELKEKFSPEEVASITKLSFRNNKK